MFDSTSLKICLFAAVWIATGAALAQEKVQDKPKESAGPALTQIAEGVYVDLADPDSNAVSNSGVVVSGPSVVVFDTHFTPEAGQALANRIHSVTPKPVRYVVLSHFHPDHTHGAQAFPSAELVSSTIARRDMLQRDLPVMNRTVASTQTQLDNMHKELAGLKDPAQQESLRKQIRARQDFLDRMARLKILPPVITVDDALTIVEDKKRIELRYFGVGHTDGDLVLYMPEEKIAFLGDLFFNRALPNAQDADLLEWIKTLGEVLKLNAEKFVPGHGPVGTREDVDDFLSYLQELKQMVEAGISRGDGIEQLIRDCKVPSRFATYQFQNFFPANVQKMYTELKAQQAAEPPDENAPKPPPQKPKP